MSFPTYFVSFCFWLSYQYFFLLSVSLGLTRKVIFTCCLGHFWYSLCYSLSLAHSVSPSYVTAPCEQVECFLHVHEVLSSNPARDVWITNTYVLDLLEFIAWTTVSMPSSMTSEGSFLLLCDSEWDAYYLRDLAINPIFYCLFLHYGKWYFRQFGLSFLTCRRRL